MSTRSGFFKFISRINTHASTREYGGVSVNSESAHDAGAAHEFLTPYAANADENRSHAMNTGRRRFAAKRRSRPRPLQKHSSIGDAGFNSASETEMSASPSLSGSSLVAVGDGELVDFSPLATASGDFFHSSQSNPDASSRKVECPRPIAFASSDDLRLTSTAPLQVVSASRPPRSRSPSPGAPPKRFHGHKPPPPPGTPPAANITNVNSSFLAASSHSSLPKRPATRSTSSRSLPDSNPQDGSSGNENAVHSSQRIRSIKVPKRHLKRNKLSASPPLFSLSPEERHLLVNVPGTCYVAIYHARTMRRVGGFEFASAAETVFGGGVIAMAPLARQSVMLVAGHANSGLHTDFSVRVFRLSESSDESVVAGSHRVCSPVVEASLVARFCGHDGPVESMSLSSDECFLSSIARDSRALFWNMVPFIGTGMKVQPFGVGIPSSTSGEVAGANKISHLTCSETLDSQQSTFFAAHTSCDSTGAHRDICVWRVSAKASDRCLIHRSAVDSQSKITSLKWGKRDSVSKLFATTSSGFLYGWNVISAESKPGAGAQSLMVERLESVFTLPSVSTASVARDGRFLVTMDKRHAFAHVRSIREPGAWVCQYDLVTHAELAHARKRTPHTSFDEVAHPSRSRTVECGPQFLSLPDSSRLRGRSASCGPLTQLNLGEDEPAEGKYKPLRKVAPSTEPCTCALHHKLQIGFSTFVTSIVHADPQNGSREDGLRVASGIGVWPLFSSSQHANFVESNREEETSENSLSQSSSGGQATDGVPLQEPLFLRVDNADRDAKRSSASHSRGSCNNERNRERRTLAIPRSRSGSRSSNKIFPESFDL